MCQLAGDVTIPRCMPMSRMTTSSTSSRMAVSAVGSGKFRDCFVLRSEELAMTVVVKEYSDKPESKYIFAFYPTLKVTRTMDPFELSVLRCRSLYLLSILTGKSLARLLAPGAAF